jgi:TP901 family phage tail tape measure protein
MEKLSLDMGKATKFSALEAAKGLEELLKAGMSPATAQAGGLEAALNLATAGSLDLTEAAETMATALNAFRKDGLSAAQTADIMAGAANAAATDVRGIGYALASAGGVADMVGISFSDLNAAIGLMSNDGLKNGSDAGTSFKSMLMYLQPQTDKAAELFERLGLGIGKANKFFKNGKIKDLAEVAQVLRDTLGSMTEQDRTATMLDIFGTDGVKAATTLYKAGAKG